jgi:hypothetical protein
MNPSTELMVSHDDAALALSMERARFSPVMNIAMAIERRGAIKEAFTKLMEAGQDYGSVGASKPTLLQPGAQKLDNLFGLVPRFPIELMRIEEDWTGAQHGGEPFFRYMVVCQLMRGEFVMGEAIGECNSWEEKYRWRSAERLCPACGKGSIIQTKHKSGPDSGKPKNFWCAPFKGGCGTGFALTDPAITGQETGRKPNPAIFDQINTLLKMAQKRAHVGATINATSASEFFTQDLEDAVPEPAAAEPSIQQTRNEDDPALTAYLERLKTATSGEGRQTIYAEIVDRIRAASDQDTASRAWQDATKNDAQDKPPSGAAVVRRLYAVWLGVAEPKQEPLPL